MANAPDISKSNCRILALQVMVADRDKKLEALRAENARLKESNLELQAKVEGIYNYLVEEKHENKRLREAGKEVVDWWLRDGMNEFEGAPAAMFNLRAALGDE